MQKILNKNNWSLRLQQLIIILLHLALLKWMYFALTESGAMFTHEVLLHFLGMSIYGALLIRGCAAWGQWQYQKDLRKQTK